MIDVDDLRRRARRTGAEMELELRLERDPTIPYVRYLPPATGTSITTMTKGYRVARFLRGLVPW